MLPAACARRSALATAVEATEAQSPRGRPQKRSWRGDLIGFMLHSPALTLAIPARIKESCCGGYARHRGQIKKADQLAAAFVQHPLVFALSRQNK